MKTVLCAALLLLHPGRSWAGSHVSLINGKDLKGWHTQGDCQWTAVDGGIRGVNPKGNWCHLVSDSAYADYAINLDYKIIRGNTGLYLRAHGENAGCCGLQGTQVDIGPSQDGSVMWVEGAEWKWYELITKAPAQGWVDYKQWNRLEVELQGTSIKTIVNGHPIWQSANAEKMVPSGSIALQLHSGGAGDTILFRNLDLYLPRKISGCLDTGYVQFNKEANFAAADSCKTRKVTGLAARARPESVSATGTLSSISGSIELIVPAGARRLDLYDMEGRLAGSFITDKTGPRKVRFTARNGVYRGFLTW
jgi:hypothetical protein